MLKRGNGITQNGLDVSTLFSGLLDFLDHSIHLLPAGLAIVQSVEDLLQHLEGLFKFFLVLIVQTCDFIGFLNGGLMLWLIIVPVSLFLFGLGFLGDVKVSFCGRFNARGKGSW